MAEISLRAYLDYIDDRLARDAYSEVVAQCRHILETYPKHIETYKLLARALAAQEDHLQDALDLFQRVLSADPNDFVAHIGMSDCYRESNAWDQAIWHLERAFEHVPNNPELQEEIKKLYQQRGGKVPRKIQLTSGALARMYAKGKLYEQAIAEIRKGIAKDPERLDLQVLLATALWESHQEMEAGRVAGAVLKRLPYSIDANRILARLWTKFGRPAEARPFVERVKDLDPFQGYELEHGEPPARDAFMMSMLDYSAERLAAQSGAADWVSQIGAIEKQKGVTGPLQPPERSSALDFFVRPSEEQPAEPKPGAPEEIPEWLRGTLGSVGEPSAPAQPSPAAPFETTSAEPDWLREALGSATPAQPQPPVPAAPPGQPAEAPDWLQEALGSSAPPSAPASPEAGAPTDAPDWLRESLGAAAPPPAASPDTQEGTPDWLEESLGGAPSEPGGEARVSGLGEAQADDEQREVPSWLSSILSETPEAPAPAARPEAESPAVVDDEWLDNFLAGGPPISASSTAHDIEIPRPPSARDTAPPPLVQPEASPGEESPRQELGGLDTWDGEIPSDWIAQDTGIGPAEPVSTRQDEEIPDWMRTDEPARFEQAAAPASAGQDEELPDWLRDSKPSEPGAQWTPSQQEEGELPDWLQSDQPMFDQEAAQPAEPGDQEALPDWLTDAETPAPRSRAVEPEPAQDEVPDWLAGAETPSPAPRAAEPESEAEQALPDWLAGMEAVESPEPVSLPTARDEETPDWLAGVAEDEREQPDWLGAAESQPAPAESSVDSETPDWLQMMGADEGEATEITAEEEGPTQAEGVETARQEDRQVAASDNPMGDDQGIPDWMLDGDLDSDDAVAWLQEIAAKYDPNFKAEGEADTPSPAAEAPVEADVQEAPEAPKAEEEDLSWLRSEPAPAAAADDELPSWLTTEEEEEKPAVAPAARADEEALSWLDQQVAEQGVSPSGIVSEELKADQPPVSAAPPPPPDAKAEEAGEEELPAWLRGGDAEAEMERAMSRSEIDEELADLPELEAEDAELAWLNDTLKAEAGSDGGFDLFGEEEKEGEAEEEEELPAWLKGEEEPARATTTPVEAEAEEDLPDWLKGMDEEEEKPTPTPVAATPTPAATEEEEEGLPDWLKGEEEPAAPTAPAATPVAAMPTPGAEEEEEELPDWLKGEEEPAAPATPAPAPVASAPPPPVSAAPTPPTLEPVREEEHLPSWLEATPETTDAGLEDFLKAKAPAPETAQASAPPAPPPVAPRPIATGPLSPPAAAPAPSPTSAQAGEGIAAARQLMSAGQLDAAFNAYEGLIGGGQSLDDIVYDLNEYLSRGKMVNPRAYRLIGDAMMAQGKLQDALEMYRRALDQF